MKIKRTKEVIKHSVEEVITGRKCDICGNDILPVNGNTYNYFYIVTNHFDWGNDSIDSFEYFDACSPACVLKFVKESIEDAYDEYLNTREIKVIHVHDLKDGA